jgi:hypothetical protein
VRVLQLLTCCAILAGCMRNASSVPATLSSGIPPALRASQGQNPSISAALVRPNGLNKWTRTGKSLFAVGAVNGKVYAVSGTGPKNSWDRGVEMYDPVTDAWTSIAPYR